MLYHSGVKFIYINGKGILIQLVCYVMYNYIADLIFSHALTPL